MKKLVFRKRVKIIRVKDPLINLGSEFGTSLLLSQLRTMKEISICGPDENNTYSVWMTLGNGQKVMTHERLSKTAANKLRTVWQDRFNADRWGTVFTPEV